MHDRSCTGSESRIEDCGSMRGQEAEQCGHKGDVGVECNTPDTSQCSEHVLYNVSAYVNQSYKVAHA